MRRMFDFQCTECTELFEELIEKDEKTLPCPVCGARSLRQLAAPRIDWMKMGLDVGFPGAYDKWATAKRKHHTTDKGGSEKGQNLKMY